MSIWNDVEDPIISAERDELRKLRAEIERLRAIEVAAINLCAKVRATSAHNEWFKPLSMLLCLIPDPNDDHEQIASEE